MKKNILFSAALLVAGSLMAADSSPKDAVSAAAKKLDEKANYSWKSVTVVPEDSPFKPGPTEGGTEKDGYMHVKISTFGDNILEVVRKGEKSVGTTQEGGWATPTEMENGGGFGGFSAGIVRNARTPAGDVTNLVASVGDLKKDGDVYSGDLTADGAKAIMSFRRGAGGDGPTISNPKGSVKFWIKDGELTKFEYKVKGAMDFNGNNFDIDRDTTVEIKDVGTTKVKAPEEAKKKL